MYMTSALLMERIWDSRSIPTKKIFYVGGRDPFAKEICANALSSKFVKQPYRMSANGREYQRFLSEIVRVNTFEDVECAIVRLSNADKFVVPEDFPELLKHVRIIFVDNAENLSTGRPLYDFIKDKGLCVNCEIFSEYSKEIRVFATGVFKQYGVTEVADSVLKEVIDRTGTNTMVLSSTIRLLCEYSKQPTAKMVTELFSFDRKDDVYEMVSALAMKKSERVFVTLKTILASSKNYSAILSRIYYVFSRIWSAKLIPDTMKNAMQEILNVNQHEFRQIQFLVNQYDEVDVAKLCSKVLECADRIYKQKLNPDLCMAVLFVEILSA